MEANRKKYNAMETYLHVVNRTYISFSKKETLTNNKILVKVLDRLIKKMKRKDELFNTLYTENFYGGSFYDGLKIGSPDEYDIDLLLKFPPDYEIEICNSNTPGFVHIEVNEENGFKKFCVKIKNKIYLDTKKVLSWMEGVVQKALNNFSEETAKLLYSLGKKYDLQIHITFTKGGPAFTLHIYGESSTAKVMDVDLVPCFSFNGDKWPGNRFKPNPYSDNPDLSDFFVVPKHAKGVLNYESRYWRLSFQKQERRLIHNKGRLKPALKLLKKMRDTMEAKQISSYVLKTVVLWEIEKQNDDFWIKNSLSYVFMHVLKKFQEYLSVKKLMYFWNNKYNLLEAVEDSLDNISNRIEKVIKDVEKNIKEDPGLIMKYLLTTDEWNELFPEE